MPLLKIQAVPVLPLPAETSVQSSNLEPSISATLT